MEKKIKSNERDMEDNSIEEEDGEIEDMIDK